MLLKPQFDIISNLFTISLVINTRNNSSFCTGADRSGVLSDDNSDKLDKLLFHLAALIPTHQISHRRHFCRVISLIVFI
jgi:hypothetical protein